MRRYALFALPIVLIALGLACRRADTAKTVLDFWAMGTEGENIQRLLPDFYKNNPEIKVRVQNIPWGAAHDLLLTAFAGGSQPDLCQLGNTWIPEFQAIGAIRALDSFLADSAITRSGYFPGIWETNVIQGAVYGIPWYVDTRLLFYRSDLLAGAGYTRPPRNWDEWRDVSCRLVRQHPGRYALFLSTIFNDWQVPAILILQNNGRLLRDNDCFGAFSEPATLEALRYYISFFHDTLAVINMSEVANIFQGFNDGVFAMMVTGPWNVNEIRKRLPALSGRWSAAPLPARRNGASIAGGASLVIFNQCRRPEAAWKFIRYLSSIGTQQAFFRLTRDLPAVRRAWQLPEIAADTEIQGFYRQLEQVLPAPRIAEWEQVAVKMQEYLEQVIYRRLTLDEAVVRLDRDVDRILEKRRWMLARQLL
ncbi:MAG TPA: sugar ABC transporter substrate-binding protein [bacterium]|nr:sugar ABC transporter substrate-binding protein [bacterium]HQG44211.1 sugar ABC transporter substrate-binding protein [bacterium]HQI47730.1 sugar ABC transporter substrate-binding protein [bacterium]HQJ64091.1 sugar ABC transporter substrate-binding protein [bacterium]